jgi:hypothetical protein
MLCGISKYAKQKTRPFSCVYYLLLKSIPERAISCTVLTKIKLCPSAAPDRINLSATCRSIQFVGHGARGITELIVPPSPAIHDGVV